MRKPALTAAEAAPWRWANNEFSTWRQCQKPACRRARRCCGEPRQCFDRHWPQASEHDRNRVRATLREAREGLAQANVP